MFILLILEDDEIEEDIEFTLQIRLFVYPILFIADLVTSENVEPLSVDIYKVFVPDPEIDGFMNE